MGRLKQKIAETDDFFYVLVSRDDAIRFLNFNSVSALADKYSKFIFEVRERGEVFLCNLSGDRLFESGVYEGHAAAFEAGAGEATTVDAGGLSHDLIEADLLGGA